MSFATSVDTDNVTHTCNFMMIIITLNLFTLTYFSTLYMAEWWRNTPCDTHYIIWHLGGPIKFPKVLQVKLKHSSGL